MATRTKPASDLAFPCRALNLKAPTMAASIERLAERARTESWSLAVEVGLVVLPCHSTRPPSAPRSRAFAQVDGPVLQLPPLGTVLRQSPGEPPVHPTDPLVSALPVQRRLGPDGVAELVAAYRRDIPVEELAASFHINRTTVLGHVRRHGTPKRDRRALRGTDLDRTIELYAEGRSADWIAEEARVAASTVRRALKDAGVSLRPGGRPRRAASSIR